MTDSLSRHDLKVELVAIAGIKPFDRNPKIHSEEEVARLAKWIEQHGWTSPIQLDLDGVVVAGHKRLLAAEKLELKKVPAVRLNARGPEAIALNLADNRLAERSPWDDDGLAELLKELDDDFDIDAMGWDEEELAEILGTAVAPSAAPPPATVPDVSESKPGEAYQLGPHRLVCGDCTDSEVIALLFGDEACDIILSDPPYCSGGFQEAGRVQGSTTAVKKATIARDNLTTAGLEALLEKAIGRLPAVGCCYVFCDWRQFGAIRKTIEPLGFQYRAMLVWDKETPGMGGPWRHQFELVYFGTRRKEPPTGKSGDVLRFKRSGNVHHTTEKPVALLEHIIANTEGEVIADPFGGSGATLLAAARQGRKARIIEIDPGYCDVIRRRWTTYADEAGIDPGPGALR